MSSRGNRPVETKGKSFIGKRYGSLVVVEFKGMIANRNAHKRESVWRANCDCDPTGAKFLYDTIRNIRANGQCPDCKRKTDKRRKQA
jgi:hypothetical protein